MNATPLVIAFGNPVYDEIITPMVSSQGRVLSGCSTNACIALARLGRRVALVGRIGADFQDLLAVDLARLGIAASVEAAGQTGGFRLIYDRHGDRTLDVLGVAEPIAQLPAALTTATAVIIGPILRETPLALIEAICAETAAPLFLDPQGLLRRIGAGGRIDHYVPADMPTIARHCHVIKANELEAQVLTGIDPRQDIAAAARALRDLGCAIAIVTLAESGSFIDAGNQRWRIPAYHTDVRDPTGAGDTYLAGFIHAYLEDPSDLYRAGCFGAAVASIWIEYTGPDAPVSLIEAERRLQTLLNSRP